VCDARISSVRCTQSEIFKPGGSPRKGKTLENIRFCCMLGNINSGYEVGIAINYYYIYLLLYIFIIKAYLVK